MVLHRYFTSGVFAVDKGCEDGRRRREDMSMADAPLSHVTRFVLCQHHVAAYCLPYNSLYLNHRVLTFSLLDGFCPLEGAFKFLEKRMPPFLGCQGFN